MSIEACNGLLYGYCDHRSTDRIVEDMKQRYDFDRPKVWQLEQKIVQLEQKIVQLEQKVENWKSKMYDPEFALQKQEALKDLSSQIEGLREQFGETPSINFFEAMFGLLEQLGEDIEDCEYCFDEEMKDERSKEIFDKLQNVHAILGEFEKAIKMEP